MKKQLPFLLLLALIGAFVFSLEGCGPDPDPCINKEEFKAKFGIYQALGDSLYEVDTVLLVDAANETQSGYTSQSILFKAEGDYDTYEWQIGDDPRTFTKKSFSLNFDRLDLDDNLKVTLTATGKPETGCFPMDDGKDTQTKVVRILPGENYQLPFLGKFEGSVASNPKRKFIIEIKDFGPFQYSNPNDNQFTGIRFYNFPEGCDAAKPFDLYTASLGLDENTYRNFYLRTPGVGKGCLEDENIFDLYGKISKDGSTLKISYRFTRGSNTIKYNSFEGKKLK